MNEANLAFGITTSDFYVPDSDEIQPVNRGIIESGDVFLFDTFSIRYLGNFYRGMYALLAALLTMEPPNKGHIQFHFLL